MNKIDKMAAKDAHDWARAEMFFGDGAGVRRRHLGAQIDDKMNNIEGYSEAFGKFYDMQNMAEHAMAAAKERQKLDRIATAGKNFRALKSGNWQNLSTGVFIVAGVVIVAHQTGYDEVVKRKVVNAYKDLKIEYKIRKARMQGRNVERI